MIQITLKALLETTMKTTRKNQIKVLGSCAILIGGFAAVQASQAATYYVAPWGKDSNAGTLSAPLFKIAAAQYRMKPGDTLLVRGGTYVQQVWWGTSGTASAPIQIKAYPGEKPVIDGENRLAANWGQMVGLVGNYVYMDGFEIKNGLGQGVNMPGHHNKLSNSNVHHHAERGVLVSGDYSIVEYTKVWWNAWYNCRLSTCAPTKYPNGGWGTGLSAADQSNTGVAHNITFRFNTVYNNWGEGLSTFEADGTVLDSNVVYDNWALNLYVSDAANVTVSNNLVYVTPNNAVQKSMLNIGLCDETGKVRSENLTIVNNIVRGGKALLGWWVDGRTPDGKMKNVLIANNTFVQAALANSWDNGIIFQDAAHENVQFMNNVVKQDGVGNPIRIGTGSFRFVSNVWSEQPATKARAWNDVYGDPQLALAGSTSAGQLTGEYFKVKSTSPAIDQGSVISSILDDYFGNPRDATPDIGAHEF